VMNCLTGSDGVGTVHSREGCSEVFTCTAVGNVPTWEKIGLTDNIVRGQIVSLYLAQCI